MTSRKVILGTKDNSLCVLSKNSYKNNCPIQFIKYKVKEMPIHGGRLSYAIKHFSAT